MLYPLSAATRDYCLLLGDRKNMKKVRYLQN